ncbi:MAG: peptidase U32 [Desulfobacteraceae bacterium 4572_89]|nr:MAG: peptidase U32 [Desulfobacteraceae bacterium 4572_89]
MIKSIKKPELLAPAGNFEKLETAIRYGADAVYLAGKEFSLRNFSGNFSDQELERAVHYAHDKNVKVYVACNVYSRNPEQEKIRAFLTRLNQIKPDALIIADPGILFLTRKIMPETEIHLSTQSNTTNINAARFWKTLGVKRVNLARELPLCDIETIAKSTSSPEVETFVHGAMCISYSGRCLLSSALSGRDSNRGLCSHPCRWRYSVVEECRPGEYHPLAQDSRGSYIFSSKDLCMIHHIPELVQAGIASLKIEGRMKGLAYLSSVVKTYREAIDHYMENPGEYGVNPWWEQELASVYHRPYCTGFYFGELAEILPDFTNTHTGTIHSFIGKVVETEKTGIARVEIRNRLSKGDTIEVLTPDNPPISSPVHKIIDSHGLEIPRAQPNTIAGLVIDAPCQPMDIIRRPPLNRYNL